MTTRRLFLKSSGLAIFGIGTAPMWLARAADGSSPRKKVLVAVFQRGAVDGLNVVVPFGEKNYYALRPTIAVPAPKATQWVRPIPHAPTSTRRTTWNRARRDASPPPAAG
jgi:uncharacterized protein (DUF1501 family)